MGFVSYYKDIFNLEEHTLIFYTMIRYAEVVSAAIGSSLMVAHESCF